MLKTGVAVNEIARSAFYTIQKKEESQFLNPYVSDQVFISAQSITVHRTVFIKLIEIYSFIYTYIYCSPTQFPTTRPCGTQPYSSFRLPKFRYLEGTDSSPFYNLHKFHPKKLHRHPSSTPDKQCPWQTTMVLSKSHVRCEE